MLRTVSRCLINAEESLCAETSSRFHLLVPAFVLCSEGRQSSTQSEASTSYGSRNGPNLRISVTPQAPLQPVSTPSVFSFRNSFHPASQSAKISGNRVQSAAPTFGGYRHFSVPYSTIFAALALQAPTEACDFQGV